MSGRLQYGNSHLPVEQQCSKLPLMVRHEQTHQPKSCTHTLNFQARQQRPLRWLIHSIWVCVFLWLVFNTLGWVRQGTDEDWSSAWQWERLICIVDAVKCLEDTHTHTHALSTVSLKQFLCDFLATSEEEQWLYSESPSSSSCQSKPICICSQLLHQVSICLSVQPVSIKFITF